MIIKLGNISPEEFASKVNTEFTPEELEQLHENWSRKANLIGPEDFHIFDGLSIHVGSASSRATEIFVAANNRKEFNQTVPISLDDRWKTE